MIYIVLNTGRLISGYIGDSHLSSSLRTLSPDEVVEVKADGGELDRACTILNRNIRGSSDLVYRFFGANAQEIAMNW
jgi:hypothetical protein